MLMCVKTSTVPANRRSTVNVISFYFFHLFNEMYSGVKWEGNVPESKIPSREESREEEGTREYRGHFWVMFKVCDSGRESHERTSP